MRRVIFEREMNMSHRKISAMIRAKNARRVRERNFVEVLEYSVIALVGVGVLACGVVLALAQVGA